jgi:hypothetical protein
MHNVIVRSGGNGTWLALRGFVVLHRGSLEACELAAGLEIGRMEWEANRIAFAVE